MSGRNVDSAVFVLSLLLRYVVFYAVSVALLIAAAMATGYWVGGIIGGLIPTMFASLMCGEAYARRTGRRAPAEVSWGAGTLFAVVNFAVGAALVLLLVSPDDLSELIRVGLEAPMGVLLIGGVALVVTAVASRIFFGLGARTRHGLAGA